MKALITVTAQDKHPFLARLLKPLAIFGIAVLLALLLGVYTPGTAQAAILLPSTRALGAKIDLAHPVQVHSVAVHSGLGRDVPPNTVPLYAPPQDGSTLRPQATFPGNCYRNTAYYVWVQGRDSWSVKLGIYTATVWYMWCPRYSGDAIGQNWSSGHIAVSGCGHVGFGGGYGEDGAWMYDASNFQIWDGEPSVTYSVCNSYAWDDSLTGPGNYKWSVFIKARLPDIDRSISISSPCCF